MPSILFIIKKMAHDKRSDIYFYWNNFHLDLIKLPEAAQHFQNVEVKIFGCISHTRLKSSYLYV